MACWVWCLWTTRLVHLSLSCPWGKSAPLLGLRPTMADANKGEGPRSHDCGPWRTRLCVTSSESPLRGSAFMISRTNEIRSPLLTETLISVGMTPGRHWLRLQLARVSHVGRRKTGVRERGCKRPKRKAKPGFLGHRHRHVAAPQKASAASHRWWSWRSHLLTELPPGWGNARRRSKVLSMSFSLNLKASQTLFFKIG